MPQEWLDSGRRVSIEFEGSFIETEVFVNGQAVGTHLGGYTGFEFDITDALTAGENTIAVRVNNKWRADQTPRIGDHQFSGGIYRDVYLNVTDGVHVTWYGTSVTTPALNNPGFDEDRDGDGVADWDYENIDETAYLPAEVIQENIDNHRSDVAVSTEVKNETQAPMDVVVRHVVVDAADGTATGTFDSEAVTVAPGEMVSIPAQSEMLQDIKLWSPESPNLYRVETTIYDAASGEVMDTYTSPLGFRWAQFLTDGFYLNGEKVFLFGANAHQDRAGWGDAGTDAATQRDVAMLKEAGMNFIRGSHYPHDEAFAQACDEQGMLFWSENAFWGMGGYTSAPQDSKTLTYTAADWNASAYPDDPKDFEAFNQSCLQGLEEMIRINRNHPSVVVWSMGNETFMEVDSQVSYCKELVNTLRNRAHQLDPTRKAGMGGTQRWNFDSLDVCDVAGYNGDGGKFNYNPNGSGSGMGQYGMTMEMPSIASEYGSFTSNRGDGNDTYAPHFNEISDGNNGHITTDANQAGIALWCAFHHGSVGGSGLAQMGFIDYSRLPLKSWYWYRETYTGVAPEFSQAGTGTRLELTASDDTITNDGKTDAQLIVTVRDDEGHWINQSPTVELEVLSGPGVFPTGKTMTLTGGNTMRDGKGSIDFHSWYSGTTVIRASAPGLEAAEITLTVEDVTGDETGPEPEKFLVEEKSDTAGEKLPDAGTYGGGNFIATRPTGASSGTATAPLATDGDPDTAWVAEQAGPNQYWRVFTEAAALIYKVRVEFPQGTLLPYTIETSNDLNGPWTQQVAYTAETVEHRPYEDDLGGVYASYVRISFPDLTQAQTATLSDVFVYAIQASTGPTDGATQDTYNSTSVYLSDLEADSITQGWEGKQPGMDCSIEGTPITVGGVVYEKGLGLHANSEAIYTLDGHYTRFQAVLGIDNETDGHPADAIYRIFATVGGEETLIYEQNIVSGMAEPVDLSVRGATRLRLVTDANGVNSNDHTDWADARLLGAQRSLGAQNVTLTAASNATSVEGGQTLKVFLTAQNPQTYLNYGARLTLHDVTGALVDQVETMDLSVAQKKTDMNTLTLPLPSQAKAGWEVRLTVVDTETQQQLGQTVRYPVTGQGSVTPPEPEWVKVDVTTQTDGAESQGDWRIWNDGYNDTELFVGDVDNPLQGGEFYTYTFTGSRLKVGGVNGPSQTNAVVYLDGVEVGTTNSNAPVGTPQTYAEIWDSGELTPGVHTVTFVPTGKFSLDYFEFLCEAPTPKSYTVTFETNGGSAIEPVCVEELGQVTKPADPTKTGYTFAGWYTDEACTQVYNFAAAVTADLTLYAKWEEKTPTAPANKTLLQKTYDYAKDLSTEGVTDTAKQAFETALTNAKAVLDNTNATQAEVDAAWDALLEGIWGLGLTQGDKTMLEQLIAKAEDMTANADQYVADHWQELVDALSKAKEVMADGNAMEEDVQPAAQALLNAILAQRFKADKSILEDLLNKAENLNLEDYTAESVAVFRSALAEAQAVMADNSLTEDDQNTVDTAVAVLSAAMDGLTAGGAPEATDQPQASQKPEATDKPETVPQTRDTAALLPWAAALALSGAAALWVMRRKERS